MARQNFSPTFSQTQIPGRAGRQMPQFQSAADTPEDQTQFIQALDEILRKNRGGFTAVGSETDSNIPFRVAGGVPVAQPGIVQQNQVQANPFSPKGFTPTAQPQEQPQEQQPQGELNLGSFMDQLDQSYQQAQQNNTRTPVAPNGAKGIASTADGGVLFDDGTIYYEDGTMRSGDPSAQGMQSMADGSIRYSDGSFRKPYQETQQPYGMASNSDGTLRYSDGTNRYGTRGVSMPGGTEGLISGIFGRNQAITQEYGNYNPQMEPGSGYNTGTDIRTKDLTGDSRQLKLPVGAEVVDIKYDDGTQWGDISGHQGYGNSVLLRLPSGEMLRFSHLSQIGEYQVGQRIAANTVFGVPGQTGNTYGEHLDLEYYNQEGTKDSPNNFSGFTDPSTLVAGAPVPGSLAGQNQSSQPQPNQPQQNMSVAAQPQQQVPTPMTDAVSKIAQPAMDAVKSVGAAAQPMSPERQRIGEGVNQTGNFLAERGVGQVLGNSTEGFVGAGEAAAGDLPAAGRELGATIERVNPTPRIDTGVSELLRGDIQGAKQNFSDTASRIGSRIGELPGQVASAIAPPAFAADGTEGKSQQFKESLGQNISGAADSAGKYVQDKVQGAKQIFSNAVQKPMEGIQGLKDDFQGAVDKFSSFQFDPASLAGDKKVGDESAGSIDQNILPGNLTKPAGEKNDIRDPFFKYGGTDLYGQYINKEQVGDGGLNLGIFNNDFYKDAGRVATVFGGNSALLGGATDKYKSSVRDEYGSGWEDSIRSQYPESEGYDRNSISDYIRDARNEVEKFLGGVNLSTPEAVFADERPGKSNLATPGINNSPYTTMSEQVERAMRSAQGDRNLLPAAMSNTSQGAMSLARPMPKAPSAKLRTSGMSFAGLVKPKPAAPSPSMSTAMTQAISRMPSPNIAQQSPASSPQAQKVRDLQAKMNIQPGAKPTISGSGASKQSVAPGGVPVSAPSAQLAKRPAPQSATKNNPGIFSKAVGVLKKIFNF